MLLLVYIRLLECIGYLCVLKNVYIEGYSLYFLIKQDSEWEYDANQNLILIKYLIYLKLRRKCLLSD